MAYISFKPSDFFNDVIYAGTGSSQSITNVGFQPNFTWTKDRGNTEDNSLWDSVRTATKYISSNGNWAESTMANGITAWGSDGFTAGGNNSTNNSSRNYIAYNWKMGTSSGLSGGSLTPSAYSINTTAKQGIYKYTGTGSTATIPHGLGSTPTAIFVKRTDGANNWAVYSKAMGNTKYIILNTTGTIQTGSAFWNDTSPTSTVFTIKDNVTVNTSGHIYVAYVFCDTPGYFKQGTYEGNTSSTDGPFIYLGFRPAMLLIKNQDQAEAWQLFDNRRLGYNTANYRLYPSASGAEATSTNYGNITANGFKITTGSGGTSQHDVNGGNQTYTYMAWAEDPIVGSGGTAGVAR